MVDLDNINKTEHYDIPEDYFESFPNRVMQRIQKENMKRKSWIASGIAAVAVLAIATTVFFTFNSKKETPAIAEQTTEVAISEEEALESLATEYYSEELALMDYYEDYNY